MRLGEGPNGELTVHAGPATLHFKTRNGRLQLQKATLH